MTDDLLNNQCAQMEAAIKNEDIATIISTEVGVLKQCCLLWSTSSKKSYFIERFITDKRFRSFSLSKQRELLWFIAQLPSLHPSCVINATIAATHKTIESLMIDDMSDCTEELSNKYARLRELGRSTWIRRDACYIYGSMVGVHVQALFMQRRFSEALTLINRSQKKITAMKFWDRNPIWFSGCISVARIAAFEVILTLLVTLQEGNDDDRIYKINGLTTYRARLIIRKFLAKGMAVSDTNQTRLKEYTNALNMYSYVSQIERSIVCCDLDSIEELYILLLNSCVRSPDPAVEDHFVQIFLEESMGRKINDLNISTEKYQSDLIYKIRKFLVRVWHG